MLRVRANPDAAVVQPLEQRQMMSSESSKCFLISFKKVIFIEKKAFFVESI
jgi:hypothetical protein